MELSSFLFPGRSGTNACHIFKNRLESTGETRLGNRILLDAMVKYDKHHYQCLSHPHIKLQKNGSKIVHMFSPTSIFRNLDIPNEFRYTGT